jgi:hypothetical protein
VLLQNAPGALSMRFRLLGEGELYLHGEPFHE